MGEQLEAAVSAPVPVAPGSAVDFPREGGASLRARAAAVADWFGRESFLVVAWGSWTLRVQSLVFPLFVLLLWLLAEDSRRPSRRVLFALPIVVLWANIHGTAFLASALVALRGLSMLLVRDRPLRARLPMAAVLTAAPALLLASPYGFSLVGYYHKLLLNPAFSKYVTEWAPTKLGIATAPFYLLALLAAWLAGRCRSRLTLFEQSALLVTLVLALLAIRSVVWFMLAALILLPAALDGVLSSHWDDPRYRHLNKLLALSAPLVCVWIVVGAFSHPSGWYTGEFPPAASDTGARLASET